MLNTQIVYSINNLVKIITYMFNHMNLKIITAGLYIMYRRVLAYLHRFFYNLYAYYI